MPVSATTPRVGFLTLGCPKNEVDTDRMRAEIIGSAFEVTDSLDDADVVVVNTCSFIEAATQESVESVLQLAGAWLPQREGRHLVVAGCMPSRYGAELAEAMPEVAAFVPVAEENALLGVLEDLTGTQSGQRGVGGPTRTVAGPSAYLQVSDGCHRSCAYCTIPSIRGPYRSRPLAQIQAEAAELVSLGAVEIVLIGQDITAWGRDLDGPEELADVVSAVAKTPGVGWVRLMYAQPDGVSDRLLAAMASHENVCRYLDMPLQHASRAVLRRMRRAGDGATYRDLIAKIRRALPGVVLRTTVISGFPGETRADAAELLRFLDDVRFDYVGVFPYSAEDGTEAAEMHEQVPIRTRRARAQRIRDLSDTIGFDSAAQQVGKVLDVLVEGIDPDEGALLGRWCGQAPEIDGVVYLDRGEPGELVRVRIDDSAGYDLEGTVIP